MNILSTKPLITIIGSVLLLVVGCKPAKNLNYFNDKRDTTHSIIVQDYEPKIQPGDRLAIVVTALNPASAVPYNLPNPGGTLAGPLNGVLVDKEGHIMYPQLGKIKVEGLSRNQVRDILLEKLKSYLTDPVVTVEFINFKVTVLGEVTRQGMISVPDGKITILEALGQAGDVTVYGKRDSVKVVREINGRREFGNINLLSNEIFKSPYFILHQNDVVYVPMNKNKTMISEERRNITLSTITSLLSVLGTLALVIYNVTR